MKILFVIYDNESPRNLLPLGTLYVAAYLKKYGYTDISFYSQDIYHYPESHLTEYLSRNRFDIVAMGFVAGYFQHKKILSICDAINKARHRPFIVLGGYGPTPVPEFYLKTTSANAVIMGEGEIPFLNLVRTIENGQSLSTVKGIAFREENHFIINERENPIKDLQTIPYPYLQSLPMEYYLNAKMFQMNSTDRMMSMITSRGCNYKCNFCPRLEKGLRFRSIENVIDEIKKYIRDYNITFIVFWDELFMSLKKRILEFCEAILQENIKINYWCTGRLNIVDEEIVKIMKQSGCKYIDYGIEQFDNYALKAMNKKLTEDEIIKGIELTQKEKIWIGFNIIFGNLGDTQKSLRKSIKLLKKYNDYGQLRTIRPVTPYPGSSLYDLAIAEGLLTGPEDFYDKHKNLELLTVNFTSISDDKFHKLLYKTNKEIIGDYYRNIRNQTVEEFRRTYFEKEFGYRGTRHT